MISRRHFIGSSVATAAVLSAPGFVRAQGKGKVKLAYLQLGWAGT